MKVDQVAHETGEDLPAVLALAELADGVLRLLDDDHQAVGAERAEELFLASVAGVQRADADAGVLGDRGDRRTRQSARASEDTTPRRLALSAVTGGPQGLERPDRWNIGPVTDGPMEHWAGYRRSDGTLGRFGSWGWPLEWAGRRWR
jgi:hypothetical protein